MAKRKSTQETSKTETDEKVEAEDVTESIPSDQADRSNQDSASDTGDTLAQNDDAATAQKDPVSDDVIEQDEPKPDTASDTAPDDAETVAAEASTDQDDHISQGEAEELIVDAETSEGHSEEAETVTETEPPVPVAPQIVRETTIERKGGFVPMLAGGAAAAILGYGVAAYVSQDVWPFATAEDSSFEDEIRAALTDQDGSLSDLGARLTTLEGAEIPTVDMTPLEARIESVQSTTDDISTRLDDLAARIDTLERQPLEQAVSPEAIAAYERALADLQAEVEAQRAEVSQMAQEAVAAEENAEETARLAASRAALAEIIAALESGVGFASAIGVLSGNGIDVPEALSANAETGVPTQNSLVTDFPDAARSALSAARSVETEASEGTGRIATFFANQLGARSVAPREGDDPDAILSRAEAAVRNGDLEAALSEISGLPEAAQTALSDWRSRAQTRLEAQSAADALVQQLLQE